MPDDPVPDDYAPSANWANMRLRAELLRRLREFFFERDFLEVETPLLSADVVIDRHLDPLSTVLFSDARRPEMGRRMWLQTSPEAAMKRLMACGGEAIYQITRSFRGGEVGPLHNPEFTIVEWYRRGDSMADAMGLLSDLGEALLGCGVAEQISYADAMRRHAGVDPHGAPTSRLISAAAAAGIEAPASLGIGDRDDWLGLLMSQLVEPQLGSERPAIVYDWPVGQAALAKISGNTTISGNTAPVARRFELYLRGIELANGYDELTCADELARRMGRANDQRHADGKPPLPPPSRLIAATRAAMPACGGVALGFDRVVMLAAGANRLSEVIAFPVARA